MFVCSENGMQLPSVLPMLLRSRLTECGCLQYTSTLLGLLILKRAFEVCPTMTLLNTNLRSFSAYTPMHPSCMKKSSQLTHEATSAGWLIGCNTKPSNTLHLAQRDNDIDTQIKMKDKPILTRGNTAARVLYVCTMENVYKH